MAQYTSNSVPGFTTTMKTRPLIVAKLDEFIRNKILIINSRRTVNEMDTFLWVNGRPEAQRGYNDDLVMSLAIACWVRDTTIINAQKDVQLNMAILNSLTTNKTILNTAISGMPEHTSIERNAQAQMYRDFAWILKG
jgi:hypothetical protein